MLRCMRMMGCKLFSKGAGPESEGRSMPYMSWSGNSHLYVPTVFNPVTWV